MFRNLREQVDFTVLVVESFTVVLHARASDIRVTLLTIIFGYWCGQQQVLFIFHTYDSVLSQINMRALDC